VCGEKKAVSKQGKVDVVEQSSWQTGVVASWCVSVRRHVWRSYVRVSPGHPAMSIRAGRQVSESVSRTSRINRKPAKAVERRGCAKAEESCAQDENGVYTCSTKCVSVNVRPIPEKMSVKKKPQGPEIVGGQNTKAKVDGVFRCRVGVGYGAVRSQAGESRTV